jgi:hypothetical protein
MLALLGGVDTDVGRADILRTRGTAVLRPYVTLLRTKLRMRGWGKGGTVCNNRDWDRIQWY